MAFNPPLHCSIAIKTALYERKHLMRACLQFHRFSPLSPRQGAWWHTGRHWNSSWSYILIPRQRQPSPDKGFWNLKIHPQGHTSFNKATPPNPSNPHSLVTGYSNRWGYSYSNHHTFYAHLFSPATIILFLSCLTLSTRDNFTEGRSYPRFIYIL